MTPSSGLTPQAIENALRGVIDPELGDNIVDLGMVPDTSIDDDGTVTVHIALTIAGCPLRTQIRQDVETRVTTVPGATAVKVQMVEMNSEQRKGVMDRARRKAQENPLLTDIPQHTRVLAIASGKGGVGKSSVTANLAVALASSGYKVGVLDADIWGFSIPRMLGISGEISVTEGKMQPLEQPVGKGAIKVLSMGFLSEENEAIMWRGLMLNRAVQHFLEDAQWGDIDYLLVDMPPGTGDVQMGLARMLPHTEMIIVTTPNLAAQKVAARAADMALRGHLRVVGVIENMSYFVCEHGDRYQLFGEGGGTRLSEEVGVPLLGQIPLDPLLAKGSDEGTPAVLNETSAAFSAFTQLANEISQHWAPVVEMSNCTARLVEEVEAAVEAGGVNNQ